MISPLGNGSSGSTNGGGGSNAVGFNMSVSNLDIWSILSKLSPEELNEVLKQANLSDTDELNNLLKKAPPSSTYEERLLQHGEYKLAKSLLLYVPPILVILGTFGNIFSFIILKRKAMLKFSTYFYLMVLAVADTLVLYIGLLRLWIGELTGFDVRDKANWLCKTINAVGYTVSDFSVWLIIAVTVERYIVVCHPLKANSMCNTPRARKVILGLLGLMLTLNIHFFWTVEIVSYDSQGENIRRCSGGPNHERLVDGVWPWVDTFVYSFLPFFIILMLNVLIIRQVVLARRRRNALTLQSGSVYEQRRPSHEGSTRLTVMLLTISFAFLLTTLPMNIVSIATAFWNQVYLHDLQQVAKFRLARTITEMLMYVNHSMNFFLYCATGQKFRHQLVWMVCYAKRTYQFSWNSEHSQATRMESIRTLKPIRRPDNTEMYAVIRSEMYTPLKCTL